MRRLLCLCPRCLTPSLLVLTLVREPAGTENLDAPLWPPWPSRLPLVTCFSRPLPPLFPKAPPLSSVSRAHGVLPELAVAVVPLTVLFGACVPRNIGGNGVAGSEARGTVFQLVSACKRRIFHRVVPASVDPIPTSRTHPFLSTSLFNRQVATIYLAGKTSDACPHLSRFVIQRLLLLLGLSRQGRPDNIHVHLLRMGVLDNTYVCCFILVLRIDVEKYRGLPAGVVHERKRVPKSKREKHPKL